MTAKKKNVSYEANDIEVHRGLDGIRKRPSLYVSDTDSRGIAHLVRELVNNSCDEVISDHASNVAISYAADGCVIVADDGRGIPVGRHPKVKDKDALAIVFTETHSGSKMRDEGGAYGKSVGTYGVGLAVVTALSEFVEVWSFRNGRWYHLRFDCDKVSNGGKPLVSSPPRDLAPFKRGTIVRMKPNLKLFDKGTKADPALVSGWLHDVSWFYPAKFTFKTPKATVTLERKGGLLGRFREDLQAMKAVPVGAPDDAEEPNLKDCVFVAKTDKVDLLLAWTSSPDPHIHSYVSGARTSDGGTHVKGVLGNLEEVFDVFRKRGDKFSKASLQAGLYCVVNCSISNASFNGQGKTALTSASAEGLVGDVMKAEFATWLKKRKALTRAIIDRANNVAELTAAFVADKKLATAVKTSSRGKSLLPKNLWQSTTRNDADRMLYIVEGLSAAGGLVEARDPTCQEVLALTGKIPNLWRKGDKLHTNERILDVLRSIGYDPANKGVYRVGQVVVAADADPDGPLAGNTRVHTLCGDMPRIRDVFKRVNEGEDIHVWARDEAGLFTPAKVVRATKVRADAYLKVTLDDGTVLRMTERHRQFILNNKGAVVETSANRLKVGHSIPAVYLLKANSDGNGLGRGEYNVTGRYYLPGAEKIIRARGQVNASDIYGRPLTTDEPLHRIAARFFYPEEFAAYRNHNDEHADAPGQHRHIDHIDRDKTNNRPENLQFLSISQHGKKDGHNHLAAYSVSEEHSRMVAANNGKKSFKKAQRLGKEARYYGQLMMAFGKVTQKTWDRNLKRSSQAVGKWDSVECRLAEVADTFVGLPSRQVGKLLTKEEQAAASVKSTIARNKNWALNTISELECSRLPVTEEGLLALRDKRKGTGKRTIGWKFVKPFVSANHKIVKIERVAKRRNFYCLTVPSTGNFYISDKSGNALLTGNSHISALIVGMLQRVTPDLIAAGRVSVLDAPLFIYRTDTTYLQGASLNELKAQVRGAFDARRVTRLKGLGELNADQMRAIACTPATRKLTVMQPAVTPADFESLVGMLGEDSALRKALLGI